MRTIDWILPPGISLFFRGNIENPGNEVDTITDVIQDSSAKVCFGTQKKMGKRSWLSEDKRAELITKNKERMQEQAEKVLLD